MTAKIYVVYDRVSQEGGAPLIGKNDGQALRDFLHGIPKEKRKDFKLYYLGNYDTETMQIDLLSTPTEVEQTI